MKRSILFIITWLVAVFLATGCGTTEVSLGQYIDLEVEYTKKTVSDEDVDNAIIDVIIAEDENVKITNRAVRNGDIANINFSGKVDGELFDGGTAEEYDLEIGSGSFIDDFEDQIIGMKIGQTKDITVTFPESYPNNPDLAGAEAVFTVKVNSIEGKVIPTKITNAMIKKISDTYTTVSSYRKYIRTELEKEADEINEQNKQIALWNIIIESSTVKNLSKSKIKYYSNIFEENYKYYADMNSVDMTTFIEEYMGITQAEYNSEKKAYAEDRAKNHAIMEAIANEEKISISNAEFQTYVDENAISEDDVKQYKESINDDALYKKVIEFLVSKNNFVEKEVD